MHCPKYLGCLVDVVRRVGLLIFACAMIPSGLAQAPDPLNPKFAEGLRSMACGACVELGSVVRPVGRASRSDTGAIHVFGYNVRAAAESELAEIIGVSEETRAKTTHVCLGASRRVSGVGVLPIPAAKRANRFPDRVPDHPDGINGVCIGSLLPIEVFLETVMADVFARRLKEFDSRLSPEKVEAIVQNRLAEALAKERALMTEDIKRAVVAELKGQSSDIAGGGATIGTDSRSMVCISGAVSCIGKTPDQCCNCVDHPNVEGTCDAQASPQSWRPRAAIP